MWLCRFLINFIYCHSTTDKFMLNSLCVISKYKLEQNLLKWSSVNTRCCRNVCSGFCVWMPLKILNVAFILVVQALDFGTDLFSLPCSNLQMFFLCLFAVEVGGSTGLVREMGFLGCGWISAGACDTTTYQPWARCLPDFSIQECCCWH